MDQRTADGADRALDQLDQQLDRTIEDLRAAAERVRELQQLRAEGRSWYEIVASEEHPLIVEMISSAIDDLGAVGGRFRREQALALHCEAVTISRIGQLFGVSRQRASVLVRARAESAQGSRARVTGSRVSNAAGQRGAAGG
jgi:hypothetical protein